MIFYLVKITLICSLLSRCFLQISIISRRDTAWNVSKYGPEIAPYLDTFHAVRVLRKGKVIILISRNHQFVCKDSCKNFSHVGQDANRSIVFLLSILLPLLKMGDTPADLNSFWKTSFSRSRQSFIRILLTFRIFTGISSILLAFLDKKNQNFFLNFFLCNIAETENFTDLIFWILFCFLRVYMIFATGCDYLIAPGFISVCLFL